MCTITPIRRAVSPREPAPAVRIPVRNAENVVIERVDPARARRLALASNATPIFRKRTGQLVGIQLADIADDSLEQASFANPRRYTFLQVSEVMPYGVHTLRYLPAKTRDLYCTAQTDCMRFISDEKELQHGMKRAA
jgi:hypothetical protein